MYLYENKFKVFVHTNNDAGGQLKGMVGSSPTVGKNLCIL